MTIEQAIAILEAERVLQHVGDGGPDSVPGTPWNDYVREADYVIEGNLLYRHAFDDLRLLDDVPRRSILA